MRQKEIDLLRELSDDELSLIEEIHAEYGVNIQHAFIAQTPVIIGNASFFDIVVELKEVGAVSLTSAIMRKALDLGMRFIINYTDKKLQIRVRRSLCYMIHFGYIVLTTRKLKEAGINTTLPLDEKVDAYDNYLVNKYKQKNDRIY